MLQILNSVFNLKIAQISHSAFARNIVNDRK